jgi:aminoglycoside phosphotransferase (APT) family kinase protein
LLRYDDQFFEVWLDRALRFLRDSRSRTLPVTVRQLERVAHGYERLLERIEELPRTFIHGEFYPANVIVRNGREAGRICPVDWELAGIAPGLVDLAALTGGEWTDDDRRKMIIAYRDALHPAKDWPPPLEELIEAVEWCQLHWAVRWLGWASDWSPPDTQSQDWLREAIRLAGRLGL